MMMVIAAGMVAAATAAEKETAIDWPPRGASLVISIAEPKICGTNSDVLDPKSGTNVAKEACLMDGKIGPGQVFNVVLTNTSRKTLKIVDGLKDRFSGEKLTFEVTDMSGRRWTAAMKPRDFEGSSRGPHYFVLKPGDSVVLPINFADQNVWEGFPKLPWNIPTEVNVRAVLDVERSKQALRDGAWTGRIVSRMETFEFSNMVYEGNNATGIAAETKEFGWVSIRMDLGGPKRNQSVAKLAVTIRGKKVSVPVAALADIEWPQYESLRVNVDLADPARPVLLVHFAFGRSPEEKLDGPDKRVYFVFRDGQLLRRYITEKFEKEISEWKP